MTLALFDGPPLPPDSRRSIAGALPAPNLLVSVVSVTWTTENGQRKCIRDDVVASVEGNHYYADYLTLGELFLIVSASDATFNSVIPVDGSNDLPKGQRIDQHLIKDVSLAEYRQKYEDFRIGHFVLQCAQISEPL